MSEPRVTSEIVDDHSLADELVASAALTVFSLAVAAGFARVFSGWDFFDNLAVVAIAGHALSLVLRRARLPLWASFPIIVAALVWLIGAMYYRSTYSLMLPTSDTWELFRLELDLVGEQFRTAVAPVAFLGGWDVLASIGVAATVVLSDTFAFRAFARAESLVPGGVLFVFVAALGSDRSRVALTVVLVAAGVLATVVLRAHHTPARSATIGVKRRTIGVALPAAVVTALVVGVVAGAIGPRIPGADAEPIYETKGGNGGSVTEVISPLVDIRSRLTNQSPTELFVVEATTDSYWRSSALPKFDGRTWGLPERGLERTNGALSVAAAGSVEIRQNITVSALGGQLLPAAADPIAASGSDELRFNADAATLVKTGDELSAGDTFEIVSASPRFSSAQLSVASSLDPGDPIYLELPENFPSSVVDTARAVTGSATTPYEAALALQNWFREEFTYSLEIQEGHGNNAIENFLNDRVGYCEQFAGTYAAMLRAVGIPSRVAVGFTQGANNGANEFSVLGRNAHAWPEVWFDGLGWVPFEPTPGRGAPGAEEYTGIAPQQDTGPAGGDPEPDTSDDSAAPAPAPTTPPTTVFGGGATPTTVADGNSLPSNLPDETVTTAAPLPDDSSSSPWRLLVGFLVIAALLAAPAVARRVRRRHHEQPAVEIQRLWARAIAAVSAVGVDVRPDLTPDETAQRTHDGFPMAARPMAALAESVTAATYAREGADTLGADGTYGTTLIGNCSVWCRQIEKAVSDSMPTGARLRRYFTTWA
ncbi:transglutaminase TgpA family protein [Ilumatobacter coccineus]|uniref:Transglutaminase-like domain-containing protein n=1 Tax=Ilumatobacter coccineus (strain NBRC 103263 / KCTC 29153 / YM16-304) TaxID=1313172 RepID=A0A6C7EAU7_ILUCY|nr:DUF3488 and transglutaminase-like domain-containing protein [Ilumatobacter coccineus]BAN02245.1 hypothetical protein YM304_19310 [Ilumatobacter coccineus YM16-304]